jgi:hypothetical protein
MRADASTTRDASAPSECPAREWLRRWPPATHSGRAVTAMARAERRRVRVGALDPGALVTDLVAEPLIQLRHRGANPRLSQDGGGR